MDELLAKVKLGDLSDNLLYQALLSRYDSTCGSYGRKIFYEQVLPDAFRCLGGNLELLTSEVLNIIERAADYSPKCIDNYLLTVNFNSINQKPQQGRNGTSSKKDQDKSKKSLERAFRRLERWLIIHNDGK